MPAPIATVVEALQSKEAYGLIDDICALLEKHPSHRGLTALINLLHVGVRGATLTEQRYIEAIDSLAQKLKEMRALEEAGMSTKQ